MDKEKYEKIINFIENSRIDIPRSLIQDQQKVSSIAFAGRCLTILEEYEDALELMLNIRKEDFDVDDDNDQYILVLSNIGSCYGLGLQNYEKAIEYFRIALNLAEEAEETSLLFDRGELWVNILRSLKKLNRKDELQKEIDERLKYFENSEKKYKSNSYIFYLNCFLAEQETEISKAIEYLYVALNNFELQDEEDENELLRLWQNKDIEPHKVYEQMEDMIRSNTVWDI